MTAYSEHYIPAVMRSQGRLFLNIREKLPGVDEKWFINAYMRSTIRSLIDKGNPKYLNMPSTELMLRFIEDECTQEYKKGDEWGGFIPEWAGKIYALYQWKYNISSKQLVEALPLSEMERLFPTLHQAGWEAAVDKIYGIIKKPPQ